MLRHKRGISQGVDFGEGGGSPCLELAAVERPHALHLLLIIRMLRQMLKLKHPAQQLLSAHTLELSAHSLFGRLISGPLTALAAAPMQQCMLGLEYKDVSQDTS